MVVNGEAHRVAMTPDEFGAANYLPLTAQKGVWFEDGVAFEVSGFKQPGAAGGSASDGALRAPMPGKIVAASAKLGDTVVKGQAIVVLEAMKMEHALTAPFDGTVSELSVAVGDQVTADAVLARVTAAS